MTKIKNNENHSERIEVLSKWIDERNKVVDYSIEQFDKLIIALSSGGLIFSVGFVKDIVKITPKTDTLFLKISWYLFAASLLSVLISQITSYRANLYEIKISEDEIIQLKENKANNDLKPYDDLKPYVKKNRKLKNFFNFSTRFLNVISTLTLIFGIVSFVIFINLNI